MDNHGISNLSIEGLPCKDVHADSGIGVIDRCLPYRYFRVSQRNRISDKMHHETLELVKNETGEDLLRVKQLPGFYALPQRVKLSNITAYRNGAIFGLDIASAITVQALQLNSCDRVLDLCCAPGAKLAMISDEVNDEGCIIGVDISLDRLFVCRAICRKFKMKNTTLVLADGCLYNPLETVCQRMEAANNWRLPRSFSKRRKRKLWISGSMNEREKLFEIIKQEDKESTLCDIGVMNLFDKVLVDAECTHDASLRHIAKLVTSKWKKHTFEEDRVERVCALQRQLIYRGFKLLREGGTMVYATCSMCQSQNEDIVDHLLNRTAGEEYCAQLSPLPSSMNWVLDKSVDARIAHDEMCVSGLTTTLPPLAYELLRSKLPQRQCSCDLSTLTALDEAAKCNDKINCQNGTTDGLIRRSVIRISPFNGICDGQFLAVLTKNKNLG